MISLILSGGVGSRLWPVSRESLPKQFSQIFGETLFSQSVKRQQNLGEVMVCTSQSMQGLTEGSIRNEKLEVSQTFYEPIGRNTAPAIGLVCKFLERNNRLSDVMGVFPSDHWIENIDAFNNALALAEKCAASGSIVTIGLKPTYPATGFGYIDCGKEVVESDGDGLNAYLVKGFKEKPDSDTAKKYIDSGHYFWNSGMFVFKISSMIDAFEKFLPDMWSSLNQLDDRFSNLKEVYSGLTSESIDYGVMEKAKNQVNIPCDIGWSDLGSWDDVADATDSGQLEAYGNLILSQAKGNFVHSDNDKLICLSQVDNLLVIDTVDALMISKKGQSQDVKSLVDQLKATSPLILKDHVYEHRPWGFYRNLYEEKDFKVKVIRVDPGQQLSYQSHEKRAEIWVTVSGKGEVVLNDEIIPVQRGQIIEVPQGIKHRMRNTSHEILKFVEVQLGDYFGEDDIIRYADDYKRV